ncbi:DUF2490 domain-containing protein [Legionella septentrionalis]|uniref:DUF2490 domain-containing protein n=1 Tax=Legionella septentrionalis TaxID=2498109 RepID=UPI000F8E35E8|nr:DUF2490 domain-containing protein [Legionella septentrionalis]RUR14872.1 DUF2490 domain-containing protein [Legionella septentrionalis]
MKINNLFSLLMLLFSSTLFAGKTFTGSWDGITLTTDPHKPFFFYFQTEGRFYNSYVRDELFTRSAIGYSASKKLSLWAGYDFFQSLHDSKEIVQGVWQQGQYQLIDVEKLTFTWRSRLEERFATFGAGTALRLRNRALIQFNKLIQNKLSLIIYDEVFLNLNHPDWVSSKTLSQNRFFLGARFPVKENTSVVMGYINRQNYNTYETTQDQVLSIMLEVTIE